MKYTNRSNQSKTRFSRFGRHLIALMALLMMALYSLSVSGAETGEKKKAVEDTVAKEKKKHEEKVADRIEQTLEYGINKDRIQAINTIHSIKTPSIRNRLLKRLVEVIKTERNSDVLEKAITVASDHNVRAAVDPIMKHLDHSIEEVKIAAVYAIKRLKAKSATGRLVGLLKKQDLSERSNYTEALVQTLGDFNATELVDFATASIDRNDTALGNREQLVLFLGKLSTGRSKEFLMKLYGDEEEELIIRAYAVNSLAKLKAAEATGKIKEVLDTIESYPFKRRKRYYNLFIYSISALARLGDREAVDRLTDSLRSDNAMVRYRAVRLLKEFKDKRTIDILKYKMENDPSPKVREAAKEVLEELGVNTDDQEKESGTDQ